MGCALGVDAGDTFTDAVLFDLRKERVRAVDKVPTTHEELSRGIFRALDNVVCDVNPDDIIQVSLSSTLATNSIVEGRGRDVGLLMLGREPDEERRFPGSRRAYVSGKFNPRGERR